MTDPEAALEQCREAGFQEGRRCHDARAGEVELVSLSADVVIFVGESGEPLQMGDATDLWEAYQDSSIHPIEDES